ncbi:hypothetical protein I0D68_21835 [Pseudomonas lalucatii]|nr:hypothetical protein I0D68_21835 [Pseudomonas lalucatii]
MGQAGALALLAVLAHLAAELRAFLGVAAIAPGRHRRLMGLGRHRAGLGLHGQRRQPVEGQREAEQQAQEQAGGHGGVMIRL